MSTPQSIAAIADIHGNRWALEAVLSDIRARGIETIVDLGDDLYGPLDLHGTAAQLAKIPAFRVQGNCDRMLIETDPIDPASTLARNRVELTAEQNLWLAAAPRTVTLENILFCHGTPWRDDEYLFWALDSTGAVLHTVDQLQTTLQSIEQAVIVCAHSHTPLTRNLPNGKLVVNVGSVGLPAYSDDAPYAHAMQSNSPYARYAILTRSNSGWTAEHISVAYDWEAAVRCAEQNGRVDWAKWLRTGTV
ncbi:metallophosphoesterase [Acidobacterium sp. S8]|uniref:metallophosphoesterase family protein n=1 Tax=Acidobacterium sp. S8 TaxID=1641854 RepID=UPI00131E3557|nr:metallophosphoesterase family protein [Acidobacterium sp. S8]